MKAAQKILWEKIREEARHYAASEPILASFFHSTILNHNSLKAALSYQLANRLDNHTMPGILLREVIEDAFEQSPEIVNAAMADILAVQDRDPAVDDYSTP